MNTQLVCVCGVDIAVSGRLVRTGRIDGELYKFVDDPAPLVAALSDGGIRLDLFTFIQRLPETSPKYAYPMEWDNLATLDLSTFDQWWTDQLGVKTRNRAKLAKQRGVTLREVPFDDALVLGVWEIYNERPLRQGKPFRHYGKSRETIRRELGTFLDSSVFIGAFVGDTWIGFAKLTIDDSRTQAGLMHIVAKIEHRDKAPTNALIAQAVRSCTERAIPRLTFSRFGYAKKQRDSLSDFKERNGFRRIDVPRYYVPLTRTGSLVLRLGLHRRATDYLPARLVEKARELRHAWHTRRTRGSARAS